MIQSMYDDIVEIAETHPFSIGTVKRIYLSCGNKQETINILEASNSLLIPPDYLIKAYNYEAYNKNINILQKEIEARRPINRVKAIISEIILRIKGVLI